jgi:hypothetical protein
MTWAPAREQVIVPAGQGFCLFILKGLWFTVFTVLREKMVEPLLSVCGGFFFGATLKENWGVLVTCFLPFSSL